jgi:hypothetical protein
MDSIGTYLTLCACSTGKVDTSLFLTNTRIETISTALTLYGSVGGSVNTALVVSVPFPYVPTQQVGADISNLLQGQRTNSRYKGTRETIKIAVPLRGAQKDLFSASQTSLGKLNNMNNSAEDFYSVYSSYVRLLQKYRVQILWRIV